MIKDYNGYEDEGFYVDRNRVKLWQIELHLLEYFKGTCEKNGLSYFLIGGSAIGAVRHQGFIPWDDDLDIGMLRPDFEKFVDKCRRDLNDDIYLEYGLHSEQKEFYPFCRLRDRNSTGVIRSQYKRKGVHGVFIEIYPFDKVPTARFIRKIQWSLSDLIIQILNYRIYSENRKKPKLIAPFIKNISNDQLFAFWKGVCTFFNNSNCHLVDTVSIPVYSSSECDLFELSDLQKTKEIPFENTQVSIAAGYDRILRKTYGDYMLIPDLEHRGVHHNTEVFYNPNKSYTEYQSFDFLDDKFKSRR